MWKDDEEKEEGEGEDEYGNSLILSQSKLVNKSYTKFILQFSQPYFSNFVIKEGRLETFIFIDDQPKLLSGS